MKTLLTLLAFIFCSCQSDSSVVIAKVGDSKLTMDQLMAQVPSKLAKDFHQDQYLELLNRWVEQEALYHEAVAQDLESDDTFQRLLEQNRKKLLIDRLMQKELSRSIKPTSVQLKKYYAQNADQFLREETSYSFRTLTMPSSIKAWQVRSNVSKTSFDKQWKRYTTSKRFNPAETKIIKESSLQKCLAKVISSQKVETTSSPFKCHGKWLVAFVDSRLIAGTPLSFGEVSKDLEQMVQLQKSRKKIVTLVQKAKAKVPISTFVEQIPSKVKERTVSSFLY
jgi:hypothetical protein